MRPGLANLFVLLISLASLCPAQTPNLTFGYRGPGDATVIAMGANGTMPLPATQAGTTTLVQFYITNNGAATIDISGASSTNSIISVFPASLKIPSNQTGVLSISFQPKAAGVVTSAMTFLAGANTPYYFNLTGTGIVPNFVLSYLLQPDGNQTPVTDGGEIVFRQTPVSQSSTATFVVANQGTGAGTATSVTISGGAFRLTGLPLLPASVPPGAALQFSVVFSPLQNDPYQGSLQITVGGSTITMKLSGQGTSASYAYQFTLGSSTAAIDPNGTIAFGQTPLNVPLAVTMQVQDVGNATGSVNSVTIVGTGFTLSNLVPLPATLTPGATLVFTVTLNPNTPGPLTGRLVIDGVTFNLTGTGLGSQLTMGFTVGSSTTPLANNGTANFPNAVAGSKVAGAVVIENTGNAPATINNVSLSGRYFGVVAPSLPARIDPGTNLSIPVSFEPNALGVLTATLGIDTQTITLRGIGAAPPNLSSYSFTGVGATAMPAEQPSVGLTLDEPYDTEITGNLRLSFTPDSFASDPAIQFSSGGVSVNFRIPAKTKTAVFGTGANSVQFQSGTVAGTINITPAFLTGEVSITPNSPLVKTVQIAAAAPVVKNLQIGTRTANSIELLLSGYSTARSLTQVNLQFTPVSGANLQTTSLSLNTDSAFTSWYQSAASQTVGSQFTASITILVNGSLSAIQSVSATAANAKGSSNASNTVSLQ